MKSYLNQHLLKKTSYRSFIVSFFTVSIFTVSFFSLAACHKDEQQPAPKQFSLDNIEYVDYDPVLPQTWELDNGLSVMFLEDDELPLVRGTLFIKGGSFWENEGKQGVVSALGSQMRQGGAGEMGPEELDLFLENMSANISSSFDAENGNVSFHSLSSDFEEIFSVFSDIVFNPLFHQSRLDLWKGQALESIRRRGDNPSTVASIVFNELMYPDSPYGRVLTSSDVQNISRGDLVQAHEDFVRPDGAILVISGPLTQQEVAYKVEKYFSSWAPRSFELDSPPSIEAETESGIYFLSMPFSQSTVYMGHQGVPRLTEDHVAIDALNHIFGTGGFTARLTRRIRSELGFAYSVYGAILPGLVRGRNLIFLQTKSESTGNAVVEALEVLRGLQAEEVSMDELEETKHAIESSFVFRLDSHDKVLSRQAILQLRDYPDDYDTAYLDSLRELLPSEIREVAKRRWDASKFVILVVGNEEAYAALNTALDEAPEPLKSFNIKRIGFDERLVYEANSY